MGVQLFAGKYYKVTWPLKYYLICLKKKINNNILTQIIYISIVRRSEWKYVKSRNHPRQNSLYS